MLSDSLLRRCDVVARGFSGYNTRLWKTMCRELPLKSLEGELALLFLGANDASAENDHEFVPLDEYKENLADIVTYLKDQCGIPQVLLIAPPPIDVSVMSPELAADGRTEELTAQYAAACIEEAANLLVPVVDTHTLFQQQPNWESFLIDGLHFNRSGSEMFHTLVLPEVRSLIDGYMPSNMDPNDLILPDFSQCTNIYPCPEISQWAQDHPVIATTSVTRVEEGTRRMVAGTSRK